jgi:hypothetical protein
MGERYRLSNLRGRVELPDRVVLLTGDTAEVDPENPGVAVLIKAGVLVPETESSSVVVPAPKTAPIDEERDTLEGVPVAAAVVLIRAEDDEDILQSWLDEDNRKTVISAIKKRLSELEE